MKDCEVHLNPANGMYFVSANRRVHWRERYQVQQFWRGMTLVMFKPKNLRLDRAHVIITFRFPDRRRRDVHNYVPMVAKPIVDGLVDAKIIPDDSDKYLVGPDLRTDPVPGPWRVVVTVKETP